MSRTENMRSFQLCGQVWHVICHRLLDQIEICVCVCAGGGGCIASVQYGLISLCVQYAYICAAYYGHAMRSCLPSSFEMSTINRF